MKTSELCAVTEIPMIGGYPAGWWHPDIESIDIKTFIENDIPVSKRPEITFVDNCITNPDLVIDFGWANHAINMGHLLFMYNGKLSKLVVARTDFNPKELAFLNSCVGKAKYYDYWNYHYEDIMKMVNKNTVLGCYNLYHTNDLMYKIYFRNEDNSISYMMFPKDYLKHYGLYIDR